MNIPYTYQQILSYSFLVEISLCNFIQISQHTTMNDSPAGNKSGYNLKS